MESPTNWGNKSIELKIFGLRSLVMCRKSIRHSIPLIQMIVPYFNLTSTNHILKYNLNSWHFFLERIFYKQYIHNMRIYILLYNEMKMGVI